MPSEAAPSEAAPSESAPLDPAGAEARFRRAAALEDSGDCSGVLAVLEGLHLPGLLADERRVLEVHRMRGHCLVSLHRSEEALRQFEDVLYIDPNYELDAFRTPPDVIACFERARAEVRAKQLELESARRALPVEPVRVWWVERERRVVAVPAGAAFLPGGLGHWLAGAERKALWFGGAQAVALGANVGCYWAMQALRSRPSPGPDEAAQYGAWQWGQVAALASLALSYGWSVVDAWMSHQALREVASTSTREEISAEEAERRLRPTL